MREVLNCKKEGNEERDKREGEEVEVELGRWTEELKGGRGGRIEFSFGKIFMVDFGQKK